jgi:hypothetical protein
MENGEVNMIQLYKTLYGSKLYGTSIETSDTDYKVIMLPNLNELLLGNRLASTVAKTNISAHTKNEAEDVDIEYIPLQIFAKHYLSGQAYALEVCNAAFCTGTIYDNRFLEFCKKLQDNFLTSDLTSMISYSVDQANLYSDKGHRLNVILEVEKVFLKFPPNDKLKDHSLKLKELMLPILKKYPEYFSFDLYEASMGKYMPCLKVNTKTFPYTNSFHIGLQTISSMKKKYGARVKSAANADGSDFKAMGHALRIILEGQDLLTNRKIIFPYSEKRVNLIKNVRMGKYSREEISKIIEAQLTNLKSLEEASTLQKPSEELSNKLNEFVIKELRGFYEI